MIIEIRDEVVSLSGSLRRNQWAALESAIQVRLRHHPTGIVLDCRGIDGMTSEGAETFRLALEHFELETAGARLVLASVPPSVQRILRKLPNVGSKLAFADTLEEARHSLGLDASTRRGNTGSKGGINLLVALLGTPADQHAVAIGCRLARSAGRQKVVMENVPKEEKTHVQVPHLVDVVSETTPPPRLHLIYLLTVSRDRPLLAPLGDVEDEAVAALQRFEESVRMQKVVALPRLERTRDPARRLAEIARELQANALAIALPADTPPELVDIVEATLAMAPCEVIVNRLAVTTPVAAP